MSLARFALAALAALVLLGTPPAIAREGTPMGHGVKCYTVAVKNADGTVTYTRVCRKGP